MKCNATWHISDGNVHGDEEVKIIGEDDTMFYVEWPDGSRSWEKKHRVHA